MNPIYFSIPCVLFPVIFPAHRPSSHSQTVTPLPLQTLVDKIKSIKPSPETRPCRSGLDKKKTANPGERADLTDVQGVGTARVLSLHPSTRKYTVVPPPAAGFTTLPAELKARIFRHLNLTDLLNMSGLGDIDRSEAYIAFRRVSKVARERQIFEQIRHGDRRVVAFCRGMAINIATLTDTDNARTALMEAVRFNHPVIVEQLLALPETDVNATDRYKLSALHFAALIDNVAICAQLLAQPGINIHAVNTHGSTTLHCAAAFGHVDLMKLLLARPDIDVNATDHSGASALHCGAMSLGQPHLERAILSRKTAAARLLLNATGIDVNCRDNAGCTPLQLAVRDRHDSIVHLLLVMPGINADSVDGLGWTALLSALAVARSDIAARLIKLPRIDINTAQPEGWTALHYTANQGDTFLVDLLLRKPKIDVNARQYDGWTPLHCAVLNGHVQTVKRLLEEPDIDIKATDNYGCNALFYALIRHHSEIARLLKR